MGWFGSPQQTAPFLLNATFRLGLDPAQHVFLAEVRYGRHRPRQQPSLPAAFVSKCNICLQRLCDVMYHCVHIFTHTYWIDILASARRFHLLQLSGSAL
jgi:hypothetical protein